MLQYKIENETTNNVKTKRTCVKIKRLKNKFIYKRKYIVDFSEEKKLK